jgi:pimeloyl-ACP methyl ester carboxylesterase
MEIRPNHTVLAVTDPPNDDQSPHGNVWAVVGENVRETRGGAHMNPARHDVVNNEVPRARWARVVLAALLGTVVSDLIGYLITGRWWDIPALLGGDPRPAAVLQPTGPPLQPAVRTVSGLVVVLSVVSLLVSTPAGLEASERGQALVGGVTPSAEAMPARYPTLHKTVKVAGLEIFYREAGPKGAPTILLLHGFPTSSHMFRALIPALSDRYHVVAPDYPGFGHSSMPPVDQFEYTFDQLADVMDQFVQQLGLTKYSLYVMDYGAPVGFRLAVKHPERVQALIVQNGNAYEEGLRDFWKPFRTYWGARTEANAAPLRKFLVLDATKWQYTHGVRNPEAISPDNWLVDQSLLDRPGNKEIQLQLFFDYGSNPALYPAWQSYFRAHQPPTLVVWGKNDYIFPADGALPYARDLKTIETHLLDTGHFALEEDGALIAQHMRRFLIRHAPSTSK